MTIYVRQSELNRAGLVLSSFPDLPQSERKLWAIRALLASGRTREATLLEINNVVAVAGITYLNDTPSPIGQR